MRLIHSRRALDAEVLHFAQLCAELSTLTGSGGPCNAAFVQGRSTSAGKGCGRRLQFADLHLSHDNVVARRIQESSIQNFEVSRILVLGPEGGGWNHRRA